MKDYMYNWHLIKHVLNNWSIEKKFYGKRYEYSCITWINA